VPVLCGTHKFSANANRTPNDSIGRGAVSSVHVVFSLSADVIPGSRFLDSVHGQLCSCFRHFSIPPSSSPAR
jgi:hypothetical protein